MEERMLSDEILLGLIKKAGGDVSKVAAEVAAIKDGVSIDSFADVETALSGKADNDIVADAFNAAETYAEGDYCTYEGGLYKFKTAHEGAWNAADVDQIQIAGELSELKNTLTSVETSTIFNKLFAKKFGDLAIISGYFIGDGTENINLGLCSGYYGVIGVRSANSGTLSNYFFVNGVIAGWDGSGGRQFTDNEQYLVSGVLVEST